MKKKDNKEIRTGQQGTGSAEQTGGERSDQMSRYADMSSQEIKDVAADADLNENDISTIKDLGGLSGRDDYAGGSDNVMDNEDTGAPTDR